MKCSIDGCKLKIPEEKIVSFVGHSSPSVLFISEEQSPNQLAIQNIGSNDFVIVVKEFIKELGIKKYAFTAILLCPGHVFIKENLLCCYQNLNKLVTELTPNLIVFFGNEGKKMLKYFPGNSIHLPNPSYIVTSSGSVYQSCLTKLRGNYGKLEKEEFKISESLDDLRLF